MKTFTVIVQIPSTELEDNTFQSALQIVLNQIVNDSLIISTTHTEE